MTSVVRGTAPTTTTDDARFLLDLLNTTPTFDGDRTDVLAEEESAGAWFREHGLDADTDRALLRRTRDAVQRIVDGTGGPEGLGPALAGVARMPRVSSDGVSWDLEIPRAAVAAARAALAWDELRTSAPGRLRACANDECSLYLIDRSKNGTARWCTPAEANRMKARRHYDRSRG